MQAYWKLIFQWKSWFLVVSGLLKIDFSMRIFLFGLRPIENVFFSESVCFFVVSGIVEDGAVPFFHLNFESF